MDSLQNFLEQSAPSVRYLSQRFLYLSHILVCLLDRNQCNKFRQSNAKPLSSNEPLAVRTRYDYQWIVKSLFAFLNFSQSCPINWKWEGCFVWTFKIPILAEEIKRVTPTSDVYENKITGNFFSCKSKLPSICKDANCKW